MRKLGESVLRLFELEVLALYGLLLWSRMAVMGVQSSRCRKEAKRLRHIGVRNCGDRRSGSGW